MAPQAVAGTALSAAVTGQPAVLGDLSIVTEHDMHLIEILAAIIGRANWWPRSAP